jgi:peroxiredoxin
VKTIRLLLLPFLLLVCASIQASPTGQERAEAAGHGLVGSPAPRLVLKTIDGDTIDLASLYGKKAVYLKFWATWCTPCREQMPHFEHSFESAGADLAVIAVNTGFNDSLEEVQKYRKAMGLTMPIVIDDGTLAAALNLRVTPQHIVIGRDGRIQYVGHLADAQLDAALLNARTQATASATEGAAPAAAPHYDVGDHLPDFSSGMLGGRTFHARDPADRRPTVLVFLSPWCESYLATSRPGLSASCRTVREQVDAQARNKQVRWLGIASGLWASQEELAAYRKKHQVKVPLTLDDSGALFRSFRVMSVPTLLLVDADGKIVQRVEGSDEHLPEQLQALLKS